MNPKLKSRIQQEIRRRAFERADILQRHRQHLKKTQYTLDALEEVTGLQRLELESIADDVWRDLQEANAGFFSIKNQMLMASGVLGIIFGGLAVII